MANAEANAAAIRRLRKYARPFLFILGLICSWWVFQCVQRSAYINALMMAIFAVCCFAIFGIWTVARNPIPRAIFDANGTTVRADLHIEQLMYVVMSTLLVASAMFGILYLTGRLNIPWPEYMYGPFAFTFGGTAVLVFALLAVMIMRGGVGSILLTPNGFKFENVIQCQQGEWLGVIDVTDEVPDKSEPWPPLVMVMGDGQFLTLSAPGTYTPDGRALRAMARFYWEHPERRTELTDGLAVERLRSDRFDLA